VLTVHLVFSVGWIGAVIAYLSLGIAAVSAEDAQRVRSAWIAMDVIGWSAIVPLAIGSLLTGLLISLGSAWGLFRHYWVLITFALTTFSVTILLLHMPSVSEAARRPSVTERGGDLLHPGLGLLVLLVVTALNVYKPRGVTPYGWRRQTSGNHRDAHRIGERLEASPSAKHRRA